ncbi:putative TP73 antisense gene protein 1 [Theropithecus gelada]|uniref:putative TP73 antisense gene protein 1 n=1 Tax=Theropithecus gelada TaxID=9565 RepID=UPI000DC168A3|nr:putative TP73 antisense gene protein 1 [Theropithecus gelada]
MCLLSSSAASDLTATGLHAHPRHQPLARQPQPQLIPSGSPSIGMVPPPAVGLTSLLPVNPTAISITTSDLSAQEDATPSTSTGHLSVFSAFQVKTPAVPSERTSQRFSEASHRLLRGGGLRWCHDFGARVADHLGLAIFGVGFGSPALLPSVVDENGCCLLYVVELCGVERAFRAEHLANTRVVREQDADIVLNDQRRFDPAFQFLHKQVCVGHALGRIHGITAISSLFPAASPASLKRAGGIFHNAAVRSVDATCMLLGDATSDTVFSGTCLLPRYGCLKRCRHCYDQHQVSLWGYGQRGRQPAPYRQL